MVRYKSYIQLCEEFDREFHEGFSMSFNSLKDFQNKVKKTDNSSMLRMLKHGLYEDVKDFFKTTKVTLVVWTGFYAKEYRCEKLSEWSW